MERAKYRYTLYVNAISEEEVHVVKRALENDKQAGKKLCLDMSFGPCKTDGSFLAVFSSDSLASDGFVNAWGRKSFVPFFKNLITTTPGLRCTLKYESPDSDNVTRCVWGKSLAKHSA